MPNMLCNGSLGFVWALLGFAKSLYGLQLLATYTTTYLPGIQKVQFVIWFFLRLDVSYFVALIGPFVSSNDHLFDMVNSNDRKNKKQKCIAKPNRPYLRHT